MSFTRHLSVQGKKIKQTSSSNKRDQIKVNTSRPVASYKDTPPLSSNPWTVTVPSRQRNEPLRQTVIIKKPKVVTSQSRYLLKKYGLLWQHKVFGRVLPSVARRHNRQKVLGNIFKVWHDLSWTSRCEWKLSIRADCHNRYRLWYMCWRSWRQYVVMKHERNRKYILAQETALCNQKRQCFRRWSYYLVQQKQQQQHKQIATEFYNLLLIRRAVNRWHHSRLQLVNYKEMTNKAQGHWNTVLLAKFFRAWYIRYCNKRHNYCQNNVAIAHYNSVLVKRCWKVWCLFVVSRTDKRARQDQADNFYHHQCLYHYFYYWKYLTQHQQDLHKIFSIIEHKSQCALLQRALLAWRSYVENQHYQSYQTVLATEHYMKHLKSKGLHGLVNYQHIQQLSRHQHETAHSFHHMKCVQTIWRVWLLRCEHCEEIKLHSLTKRAREYHCNKVLLYYWRNWQQYIVKRQMKFKLYHKAICHFKMKMMPKFMCVFKENVQLVHEKRRLKTMADNFRSETLLCKSYYHWWRTSLYQHDMKLFLVKHDITLMKAVLIKWRRAAYKRLHSNHLKVLADNQYHYKLKSTTLSKWRNKIKVIHERYQLYIIAGNYHQRKQLLQVWQSWKMYVLRKREKMHQLTTAHKFCSFTLLKQCITTWKARYCKSCKKKVKVHCALDHYNGVIKRRVFDQWHVTVNNVVKMRAQLTLALQHQHKSILMKALIYWRIRTYEMLQLIEAENQSVAMATEVLNQVKLTYCFNKWHEQVKNKVSWKKKSQRAYQFNTRRLLKVGLYKWLMYHQMRLKIKNLSQKSHHFNEMRVISLHYSYWRVQFMEHLVQSHQTSVALWKWSQMLQHKVIKYWYDHVTDKKRKKCRYNIAMDIYRTQLLTRGVTQWIKVATSIQSCRSKRALTQQSEANNRVWQCVQKCATHWRAITIKRKQGLPHCRTQLEQSHPGQKQIKHIEHHQNQSEQGQSHCRDTTYWDQLVKTFDIPSYPRLPPRKPDYLTTLSHKREDIPHLTTPSSLNYRDMVPSATSPRPITPPTLTRSESFTFLSTSSDSSHYGNKLHHIELLAPQQCKLLPPSAFTIPPKSILKSKNK